MSMSEEEADEFLNKTSTELVAAALSDLRFASVLVIASLPSNERAAAAEAVLETGDIAAQLLAKFGEAAKVLGLETPFEVTASGWAPLRKRFRELHSA